MDIYEIRIQRLREIIGDRQLKDFANSFDLDASYLSQLLNGHRRLGERAAQNIESKLGLAHGELGRPKTGSSDREPSVDVTSIEAAKLKAIYQARKKTSPSLTQAAIAEQAGWTGQSVVSQYLNGRIPLNLTALIRFANILEFEPAEVSPRLAKELGEHDLFFDALFRAPPLKKEPQGPPHVELHRIDTWSDETPLDDDEVEIPFFKEVELAAGKGSEVMLETGGRKLRFGKRTLQRKGIPPEAAAAAVVTGNSMEPVLPDGSTVGVDTSRTQVTDGQMYAINHEGQLRVKVLYRTPGNGLRLRSYNSDEHPDERYDGTYVAEHIRIIGKVFWYSVLI